jgi:hypothetical protein
VLKLPLLDGLQQKVGEIIHSITSCPLIIILENTLNQCIKNVVVVTVTSGIMFLLFTCMHFGGVGRWPACAPTVCKVVHDCRKFEEHYRSRVSSGSIVSDYGLEDRAIGVRFRAEAKDFSSILCVQTGSGAHPASCTMGTGGPFPGGKSAAGA